MRSCNHIKGGQRGRRRGARLAMLGLASFLVLACSKSPEGSAPAAAKPGFKIAAASDLSIAFEEAGREYERLHQEKVTLVFGASGMLAKQIVQGAPYDAFYSANAAFADESIASGNCDAATKRPYASSHIVIWARDVEGAAAPGALADLEDGRFRRIAIANPDHAPYGRAAKEALERAGMWEKLQGRILLADSVKHALVFAESGNADAAIVPLPLTLPLKGGKHAAVDKALYAPVEQTAVDCLRGSNVAGARRFAAFLDSEHGRALMRRHGFVIRGP